jgi:hypothetical protein
MGCDNVYNVRNEILFFGNYSLKNSVAKLWNIGITTMIFEKVFNVNDKNHILKPGFHYGQTCCAQKDILQILFLKKNLSHMLIQQNICHSV